MKQIEKNYHTKTETIKYLELIGQNNIRQHFNTDSKVCKFSGHASINSIINNFSTNYSIYLKFLTLNWVNMCSRAGYRVIHDQTKFSLIK